MGSQDLRVGEDCLLEDVGGQLHEGSGSGVREDQRGIHFDDITTGKVRETSGLLQGDPRMSLILGGLVELRKVVGTLTLREQYVLIPGDNGEHLDLLLVDLNVVVNDERVCESRGRGLETRGGGRRCLSWRFGGALLQAFHEGRCTPTFGGSERILSEERRRCMAITRKTEGNWHVIPWDSAWCAAKVGSDVRCRSHVGFREAGVHCVDKFLYASGAPDGLENCATFFLNGSHLLIGLGSVLSFEQLGEN